MYGLNSGSATASASSEKFSTRGSLTNYLHGLAPEMAASELLRKGNYQFSFIVDGAVVHKENFHPAWLGSAENKNTQTPNAQFATDVDTFVELLMSQTGLPSLAIAVVKGDEPVLVKGYGLPTSSVRFRSPRTPRSIPAR